MLICDPILIIHSSTESLKCDLSCGRWINSSLSDTKLYYIDIMINDPSSNKSNAFSMKSAAMTI